MQRYRRTQAIYAMTFDLDDTLYDNHPVIERVEQKMVVWLHTHHPDSQKLTLEQWHQIKCDVAKEDPRLYHDVSRWRHTQIVHGLFLLGYTQTAAIQAANDGMAHALWWRNQVEVPELTHQVLSQLAQKFPLVAITNGNVDVQAIGLESYFTRVLRAGPDGKAKPHGDLFHQAQKILQQPAQHILHVGDHVISDVQGAVASGFQSCWFNDGPLSLSSHPQVRSLPDIEINQLDELLTLL
ncbi:2-haloalkanoic acid dehalogenase [Vibrio sp. 10N.286.49.B3]|uniref:5-amino-6-(5-phospho-D-ribitylamino)uracil phosphatase YigB n=1 Tax=Vibrio sp. 10N.286.49.B3 TaxID=1880855 RepID=UPI000C85DB5A|nr:5-amino-6-(5-phospho-D-ribitylamino)uracil phosphatase YigB [Vibrio sp. 10N.286.49.B3]PMH45450.1 2-haloalkanoic acid dehalogenase [Vibrio sp. 10N.286.49.B3]